MASRELNIIIKATAKGVSAALKGVKSELKGIDKTLGKGVSNAWKNTEKGIVVGAGAAAAGIGYAVKQAIDFEDAFAGVKKTVDATDLKSAGLSFDKLSESFRKMSREIPITVEELSQIGEAAGALGIPAKDIEDFTKVVATLTVTTDLTADDAATALGQLGNVLHLSGKDFDAFADSLVALGNNGASTEPQIIEIAKRFGAAGHSAGLATADVLALASTTASMGVEVEAGGSALSRVFNNIATGIGTGSEKAKNFAKSLGMSAKEFKKAWATDAIGTFDDFLERLSKLDQFDAAALLKSVGITNTRDVNAIRLLSQGYKELDKQIDVSRHAAGAMDKEAQQRYATTKSQLQVLKNNLDDAAITIGQALLPQLKDLSKAAVDWIQGHQPQIRQFAADLADGLRQAVTWASKLDWEAIGNTLKTVGGVGKTLLDTFLAMPSWVQVAVATGWGLNKFTGGAVGTIVGELGKGLIKGVLNMNAGVVNVKGAVVNAPGGGAGPAGGAPGGLTGGQLLRIGGGALIVAGSTALHAQQDQASQYGGALGQIGGGALAGSAFGPAGTIVGGAVGAGLAIGQQASIFNSQVQGGKAQLVDVVNDRSQGATVAELSKLKADLKAQLTNEVGNPLDGVLKWAFVNATIEDQIKQVDAQIRASRQSDKDEQAANRHNLVTTFDRGSAEASRAAVSQRVATNRVGARLGLVEGATKDAARASRSIPPALQRIEGVERGNAGRLQTIANKNPVINNAITVISQISIRALQGNLNTNTYTTVTGRRGGALV